MTMLHSQEALLTVTHVLQTKFTFQGSVHLHILRFTYLHAAWERSVFRALDACPTCGNGSYVKDAHCHCSQSLLQAKFARSLADQWVSPCDCIISSTGTNILGYNEVCSNGNAIPYLVNSGVMPLQLVSEYVTQEHRSIYNKPHF